MGIWHLFPDAFTAEINKIDSMLWTSLERPGKRLLPSDKVMMALLIVSSHMFSQLLPCSKDGVNKGVTERPLKGSPEEDLEKFARNLDSELTKGGGLNYAKLPKL